MFGDWLPSSRSQVSLAVSVFLGFVGVFLLTGLASSSDFNRAGVELGPDHTRRAQSGDTVLYNHILSNTGTATNTYLIEVVSTQDWPVALVKAAVLAPNLTLQVAAQTTAAFQVSLTVPMDVAAVTEVTRITATSQLSPTIQDTATDTTIVPAPIYLPFVANRWPPIPSRATLDRIDNADGNGFYKVTWPATFLAQTYSLEEDVSAAFTAPKVVYSSDGFSWSVPDPGKPAGTYYYRVRGRNQWGYGAYSNDEAVTVLPLRVDDVSVPAGQCTILRWEFQNIKALYISFGYGYDKEGVPGTGTRVVCPSVTTTYEARVVRRDDSHETHQAVVNVSGSACGDPVIEGFYANTYNVRPDEEFSIAWDVECAKTVHLIIGSGPEEPVAGHGSRKLRIYTNTLFKLKVQKSDGSFVYRSFTVYVS
jgi:hypothetical protein